MPTEKNEKKKTASHAHAGTTEYRGKQTKTGNSSGFRFEAALFKSHPEFSGEVTARVIAPGRLLVTAELKERKDSDPVMAYFLAFLAGDIANAPHLVRSLDSTLAKRIDQLVDGIDISPDEELEDEVIL